MANNRMYLVNDRLKKCVYLAKYYPSSNGAIGWYTHDWAQSGTMLDKEFDTDTDYNKTPMGAVDWRVVYEISDDKACELTEEQWGWMEGV